jgi:AcrR family transcriptional regulator
MATADTRARILETALGLFNERGVGAVSTNHIAAALGISPGNLYYHFRNKEEIVRAIVEQKDARWEALYRLPEGRAPTLDDVERLVRKNFALVWEYRFFSRELGALTQRDPPLRARYRQLRQERLTLFEELFGQFVRAGVADQPDSLVVAHLAQACWLISEYWLPFQEIEGELTLPDVIEQGVALYMQVLQPYMRQTARDSRSSNSGGSEPAQETDTGGSSLASHGGERSEEVEPNDA